MLVTVDRGETRVAMLEASGDPAAPSKSRSRSRGRGKTHEVPAGYRVAEIYFERRGGRSIVGNIYKGRVDNVLAGLEAAFVDIGLDKNGFLHVDEIVLPGVEQAKRGRGNGPRITDLLKPGQEIVVQVVKDPLKTKGARLSMELTIAGRYMVYAPTGEGVGVSRRLEDKERDRLRKEAKQLDLGGGGAIIRTAAHGATRADFERELQYLFKLNEVLEKRVKDTAGARARLPGGRPLGARRARHLLRALRARDRRRRAAAPPAGVVLLAHRAGAGRPRRALRRRRPAVRGLRRRPGHQRDARAAGGPAQSGGYLIIDYAEALTVIDVNTGSFTGKGKSARLEDTITKTNLEAADEVVRQLRLRDIGGIIVIDFIDMARSRNRDAVLKVLRKALDEDRTKTFVVEISPLGLVEMTRQNVTDGVREIMTKPCPVCSGEGVVKSEETIAIEFARHLRHMVIEAGEAGPEAYLLRINPKVTAWFIADGARELHALERETGRYFHFEGSDGLPLDHFAVTMEGTRRRDRGARRAVPGGRRGPREPRRAAHVQRRRRGGQGRRLPDRRRQRRRVRGREEARPDRGGGPHDRPRGADRRRRRGRRGRPPRSAPRRARRRCRAPAARRRPSRARREAPRGHRDAGRRDARRGRHRARRGRGRRRGGRDAAPALAAPPALRGRRRRGRRRGGRRGAPAAEEAPKPAGRGPRAQAPGGARGRGRGGRGRRRAGAEAEEAPAPARKGRARKRPAAAEVSAEEAVEARAEVAEEEAPAPKRRARRAKPAAEPEPEAVEEAEEDDDDEEDGDDALSSRPRRRGRRGGRRRSRAKAQADAEVSRTEGEQPLRPTPIIRP